MSAVYAVETFDDLIEDIQPLLEKHWEELALYQGEIKLEPDYDRYRAASESGVLKFFTVRLDGALIGYAIYTVVKRHLHYNHMFAINDIIWVRPDHRKAGIGNGLFDFVESELSKNGPVVIHTSTKEAHPDLAMLLMSRGHAMVGRIMSKRLG